jgi:hypothetical protein
MPPPTKSPANAIHWRIIGHSARGASHVQLGMPNQDAFGFWLPESGAGPPAILAIADGHGSAPHFRSADGAKLAVEAATALLLQYSKLHDGSQSLAELQTAAAELPRQLVENWVAKVTTHLAAKPFRDEEYERLGEKEPEARVEVSQNPLVAYGATLLSVLITDSYALCMQIGDGDILFVDDGGATSRPVPPDPRLIANQTTSLCQPQAPRDFRLHIESPLATVPALVLVSTDGYVNSFKSDADFLQIGPDFLAMARADGLTGVGGQLPGILQEASEKGSGDDVTFGIMRRVDGEEGDMGENVPRAEWESLRTRLDSRLQMIEQRLALQWRMLIVALVLAVAALAVGIALKVPKILPGNPVVNPPSSTTANPPDHSSGNPPPHGMQNPPSTNPPTNPPSGGGRDPNKPPTTPPHDPHSPKTDTGRGR